MLALSSADSTMTYVRSGDKDPLLSSLASIASTSDGSPFGSASVRSADRFTGESVTFISDDLLSKINTHSASQALRPGSQFEVPPRTLL